MVAVCGGWFDMSAGMSYKPAPGAFCNTTLTPGNLLVFENDSYISHQVKTFAKTGLTVGEAPSLGVRLRKFSFLGGVSWSRQMNEQYTKAVLSPTARVEYRLPVNQTASAKLFGRVVFPDRLSQNRVSGAGAGIEVFHGRLYLREEGTLYGYRNVIPGLTTIQYGHYRGFQFTTEVGFVFGKALGRAY